MWCEPRRRVNPVGIPDLELSRHQVPAEADYEAFSSSVGRAGLAEDVVMNHVNGIREAWALELAHEEDVRGDAGDNPYKIHCIQTPTRLGRSTRGVSWLVHYVGARPEDAWWQPQSHLKRERCGPSWEELISEHRSGKYAACGRAMQRDVGHLPPATTPAHAPDMSTTLAAAYASESNARCTLLYMALLGEVLKGVAKGQQHMAQNLTASGEHRVRRAGCTGACTRDFLGIVSTLPHGKGMVLRKVTPRQATSVSSPSGELLQRTTGRNLHRRDCLCMRAWAALWGGSDAVSAPREGQPGITCLVGTWHSGKKRFSQETHPDLWASITTMGEAPLRMVAPPSQFTLLASSYEASWLEVQRLLVLDTAEIGEVILLKVLWHGTVNRDREGCQNVPIFGTMLRGVIGVIPRHCTEFVRAPSLAYSSGRSTLLSCEVHGPISAVFSPDEVTAAGYIL